jgi:hypothetical protein
MIRRFHHLFPLDGRLFKGGKPSDPLPIPPAIRETSKDVQAAGREERRFRNARNMRKKSLIAGETGGFAPAGSKDLLGQ